MANKEKEIRELITELSQRCWQLGWVAANDGNISAKLEENVYITTPTGLSKSFVTPEKLVKVDGDGNIIEALDDYKPSSEFPMHLRCYKEREDINAVFHAHPPTATGFAIANIPLDRYTMPEAILGLGEIGRAHV